MPLAEVLQVPLLHDCRCTSCGQSALSTTDPSTDSTQIIRGAIACEACGVRYDTIWGVPFLAHYEFPDATGLIEIAANAREDNAHTSLEDVVRIENILRGYHAAADKTSFVAKHADPYARAYWLPYRYTEYATFTAIAKGVEFAGRDVLDVGAGGGFDAWRLMQAGGRVTAIEYNPMLIRRGRAVLPEARWFGGLSHVLPFKDESFDIVCCNAALHHMRDVPLAMQEMLRVLRPGGWLLTTGDPFRSDRLGDEHELDVFNRHTGVVLGINECIPSLSSLVETLVAHQEKLDVRILTSDVYGLPRSAWRSPINVLELCEWQLKSIAKLTQASSGTIAMRVRKKTPISIEATRQDRIAIGAGEYAEVLTDYGAAISALTPLLPKEFVDRPFPGTVQIKFELLNGWQKQQPQGDHRSAYRRARWFLTRPEQASNLSFQVRYEKARSARKAIFDVHLDGQSQAAARVEPATDSWFDVTVPLTSVASEARFVCELRMSLDEPDAAEFEDYVFLVRDRRFT